MTYFNNQLRFASKTLQTWCLKSVFISVQQDSVIPVKPKFCHPCVTKILSPCLTKIIILSYENKKTIDRKSRDIRQAYLKFNCSIGGSGLSLKLRTPNTALMGTSAFIFSGLATSHTTVWLTSEQKVRKPDIYKTNQIDWIDNFFKANFQHWIVYSCRFSYYLQRLTEQNLKNMGQ